MADNVRPPHKAPHRKGPRLKFVVRFFTHALFDLVTPIKKIEAVDPEIKPDKLQVWMIGHATMLINFYGTTILTDPVFGSWLPFPRRKTAPGLQLEQIPPLDFILKSHSHWDHFHLPSVKQLADRTTTVVVAKNCSDLVAGMDFDQVVELNQGQIHQAEDITITTYQPHHWGQRLPWEKPQRGHNAYVIEK
jgi:L-ascorbate metabolism protein UlaG (beta-lactamase superfamily)